MTITGLSKKLLPILFSYNEKIYPDKVIKSSNYLNFWLFQTHEEYKESIVLADDDQSIHGQILVSRMSYFYKGKKTDAVWLFDLIVDEDLRKDAWGVDIIIECFRRHPNSFSTGSGPEALPIHLKLGNKMLGEIRKYVGAVHPLFVPSSLFRGNVPVQQFPVSVNIGERGFHKISKGELFDKVEPYNTGFWETSRDKAFLKWRFFNELHDYAFYKDEDSDDFFVVRTIVQHHVTLMLLVDYRCNASDADGFMSIYKAVSKIMQHIHLGILVAGSSLASMDSVLEQHHFKSIGRPRPIIGFLKVKDRIADIEARNFAFVTFADSDGETNWT